MFIFFLFLLILIILRAKIYTEMGFTFDATHVINQCV